MTIDVYGIKENIVDLIKRYVSPENVYQSDTPIELNKQTSKDIAQSFIPYSTVYRGVDKSTFNVYLNLRRIGDPSDPVIVHLCSDQNDRPSNTIVSSSIPVSLIPSVFSYVPCKMDLSKAGTEYYLGSNTKYWLKIESTPSDPYNFIELSKDSIDTNYRMGKGSWKYPTDYGWYDLGADINFRVSVPSWVYPDYPYSNLSVHSFPRIAVDIVGRPRISERWIDHRISEQLFDIAIIIYSRYPKELDDIISLVDQAMWKERLNVPNIKILTPRDLSSSLTPREGLFVRTLIYQATVIEKA